MRYADLFLILREGKKELSKDKKIVGIPLVNFADCEENPLGMIKEIINEFLQDK